MSSENSTKLDYGSTIFSRPEFELNCNPQGHLTVKAIFFKHLKTIQIIDYSVFSENSFEIFLGHFTLIVNFQGQFSLRSKTFGWTSALADLF